MNEFTQSVLIDNCPICKNECSFFTKLVIHKKDGTTEEKYCCYNCAANKVREYNRIRKLNQASLYGKFENKKGSV